MSCNLDRDADQAEFYERKRCISCQSEDLHTLDRGTFGDEPHRSLLLNGIWGESPFPHLEGCTWELVECKKCGQVFHKRVMTNEWEDRRFSHWMTREAIDRFEIDRGAREPNVIFDRARGEVDMILCLERMTRATRGRAALRLLDFGCGWGRFVALSALFGFEAYGIDRHEARRGAGGSIGSVLADLQEYRDNISRPLHVATMFQVLEHLHDPMHVLRALHDLIVPNGLLVLEVPNGSGLRQLQSARDLEVCDGIDHINAFSPTSLVGIARRAGFVPVQRVTAHVTADFLRVVKREARRLLARFRKRTTNVIFTRV